MPRPDQNRHLSSSHEDDGPTDVYPLPDTGEDPRFTLGLIIDVANVLVSHGYPRPTTGTDYFRLHEAMFGFLHGSAR
jgi:hypothetical protein